MEWTRTVIKTNPQKAPSESCLTIHFFSDNGKVVIDEINDGISPDAIKAIQEEIESGNPSTIVDTIDIGSDDDLDSIADADIIAEL